MTLIESIDAAVRARRLLPRGARVLVAVSGGLDSMVLLYVLQALAPAHRWKLHVAHLHHGLRGRSADADERLVRRTAARLRLPYVAGRADVNRLARESGQSVEMAAREARHQFLARTARQRGIKHVALAHHADDQVELFFLRLLRGAGGAGLAGMKWTNASPASRRVRLVRPLLDCTRGQLAKFARGHGIEFREDATNASGDMLRNRIRHQLLPLLEGKYQPAVRRITRRIMDLLGAEADWLEVTARTWLKTRDKPFARLPVAVQRQCLVRQLTHRVRIAPDFEWIEHLRLHPGEPMSVSTGRVIFRDEAGTVHVRRRRVENFRTKRLEVDLKEGRGTRQFDGVAVNWQRVSRGGTARPAPPMIPEGGCEWFDAERVGPTVILRHWSSGDRFQPIGMAGSVKLQDWFTNRKVPAAQRRRLIVATTMDGEIFWIEGQRIGERFKLDKTTRRRLKWVWRRVESLPPVGGDASVRRIF